MYAEQGLGVTTQQVTGTIGGSMMAAGGIVAAIPGGQLPGAIIAATGALTSLIGGLFRPDVTKIQTTQIVDQIELQTLKPLLESWGQLAPEQKTTSMQAYYLGVFDRAWAAVQQACSNPQFGEAGRACIADRVRGGRFPWPVYYRDPVANDPDVRPDPISELFSGASIPLLVMGGLVAWAVLS